MALALVRARAMFDMPWTRKQVKLLLSDGSPLSDEEKAKMKAELHENPELGHKQVNALALRPKKKK